MANAISYTGVAPAVARSYSPEMQNLPSDFAASCGQQYSHANDVFSPWSNAPEENLPANAQHQQIHHQPAHPAPVSMPSPLDPQLKVDLQDKDLWDRFSAAQTEMIVTKPGRRMFPGYRVRLSGMEPSARYCVLMDIVSVDQHRYKFQHGEWTIAGRGEPQIPQRLYLHPSSPATGQQWMREIVSFHKVKLTNSCGNSADGKFLIHSMHRYQPRIHVIRTDDVSTLHLQPASTFSFPQTVFITVTAYQNHEVTKLKVDNNPFARGFRTNGGKTKNAKLGASDVTSHAPPVFNFSHKRAGETLLSDPINKRWRDERLFHNPPNSSAITWPLRHQSYLPPPASTGFSNFYPVTSQCPPMPLAEVDCNQQSQYQTSPGFASVPSYDFTSTSNVTTSPVTSLCDDAYSPVTPSSYDGSVGFSSAYQQAASVPVTSTIAQPALGSEFDAYSVAGYQAPVSCESQPPQEAYQVTCESQPFGNSYPAPVTCQSQPFFDCFQVSAASESQPLQAYQPFSTPPASVDEGYFSTPLSDDVKDVASAIFEAGQVASQAAYNVSPSAVDVTASSLPNDGDSRESFNVSFNLNLLAQSATQDEQIYSS